MSGYKPDTELLKVKLVRHETRKLVTGKIKKCFISVLELNAKYHGEHFGRIFIPFHGLQLISLGNE